MSRKRWILALMVGLFSAGLRAQGGLLSDRRALAALAAARSPSAWKGLRHEADGILALRPASVMDKVLLPPSGDRHDYYSLGSYFWPDPANPEGPYIRRDGRHNPQCDGPDYDKLAWDQLARRLDVLAEAWVLTHDPRYGAQAELLARVWFLDPATCMNPNLNFAGSQPGRPGPFDGVVESGTLPRLVDSLTLLADSPAFSPADQTGLKAWMGSYLTWLLDSWAGRRESDAINNRGVWYDAQVAALALYVGRPGLAMEALRRTRERLHAQVAADGSLPAELRRTKSFSYSVYDLRAFFVCARLGQRAGVDLWAEPLLRKAVETLAPFADPAKPWPYPQIVARDQKGLAWLLAMGAGAWKDDAMMALARQAGWQDKETALRTALFR